MTANTAWHVYVLHYAGAYNARGMPSFMRADLSRKGRPSTATLQD